MYRLVCWECGQPSRTSYNRAAVELVAYAVAARDESHGGVRLPDELADWMRKWLPEVRLHGVHFSHAGPTPGMASFDDFFYADTDTKHWWRERPYYVHDAGHKFGVYGHTVMPDGIYINKEHGFAMIDALEKRQYLDMLFHDDGEFDYRVTNF